MKSILGKTIFIVGAIILIIYGAYISFLAFSYTIRVSPALSLTDFTPTEALVASLWEFLIKMFTNLFIFITIFSTTLLLGLYFLKQEK
jgi:hypothetical protein